MCTFRSNAWPRSGASARSSRGHPLTTSRCEALQTILRGFLEHPLVAAHAERIRRRGREIELTDGLFEHGGRGLEARPEEREKVVERDRDESLGRAGDRAGRARVDQPPEDAVHGRTWHLRAHADLVAGGRALLEERRVGTRLVQAEAKRRERRKQLVLLARPLHGVAFATKRPSGARLLVGERVPGVSPDCHTALVRRG